jgi:F420-0:gamma-glutamyl ligase
MSVTKNSNVVAFENSIINLGTKIEAFLPMIKQVVNLAKMGAASTQNIEDDKVIVIVESVIALLEGGIGNVKTTLSQTQK